MNEKLNFKFAATTIILLIVMLPVFAFIHELGHVTICHFDGREYNFSYNWTSCAGKFDDPTMYRMAGGFLSSAVALTIFAGIKNIAVKRFKPVAIVLVIIAITEFTIMLQETFIHEFYMDYGSAVSGMLMLTLSIVFIFRHSPRTKREIRA